MAAAPDVSDAAFEKAIRQIIDLTPRGNPPTSGAEQADL